MSIQYEKLERCYEYYRSITEFHPRVGLILGSGLGGYAKNMHVEQEIPYREISDFPVSTVQGHDGRFLLGWIGKVPVVVMKGRVHYYEGYSMEEVVLPVRLMKRMGIEILFLTLIGQNIEELGTRFPDMTHIYDEELQQLIRETAEEEKVPLREGVYLQTTGPNFESPAEVKMYGLLGADAVGMSTACEAIAARHAGIRVCGISCVSNMASGISGKELSHQEVQAVADQRSAAFERLVTKIIEKM